MRIGFHISIYLTLLLLIVGGWYWFGYRPANIRSECSWIHVVQPAVEKKSSESIDPDEVSKMTGWEKINAEATGYSQPAKDYWTAANEKQYSQCLRSKGLSQ